MLGLVKNLSRSVLQEIILYGGEKNSADASSLSERLLCMYDVANSPITKASKRLAEELAFENFATREKHVLNSIQSISVLFI